MVKILGLRCEATEYQECLAFYNWCIMNHKIKGNVIKHVNEGKRSKIEGVFLKMIGFTKGLPDYQIILPNKNWHGLFIEMKKLSEKNRKKRPEQVEFIEKLIKNGYYASFAYGCEDAINLVNNYLNDNI